MVFYPIKTLVRAGIKELLIVVSGPHAGHFISVLKNGQSLGIKHLEYAYQDNPQGGIANALSLAENFADNKPITMMLGDNTTDADISKPVNTFTKGALIFLKKVSDPQRFGVPRFDLKDNTKIAEIIEKPKKPPSNFAVTGLYIYDNQVFEFIKKCRPSYRNEMEITDVNNFYIKVKQLRWAEINGYWLDAGTFETLLAANVYWAKKVGVSI
jgi:glucose-1-phosphate thymidylyltransferase